MKKYQNNSGTIIGKGGIEIFFQSWTVPNPTGLIVISHGIGEHSGRYNNLIEKLSGKKISIYAIDHRGHGKSGGIRGHIDSITDYISDLKLFVDLVKDENRKIPLILLGHSMGGLVAMKFALEYPDVIDGLILSSAFMHLTNEPSAVLKFMVNFFSKAFPSIKLNSRLKAELLSHDSDTVDLYENDPLVHSFLTPRWLTETARARLECLERAKEVKMPLLIFHGEGDSIVDNRGSSEIFEKASSKNKELFIFKNLYHETMNETKEEREEVLTVVSKWLLELSKKRKTKGRGKKAIVSKSKSKPAAKKKSKSKPVAKKKTKPKPTAKKKVKSKPAAKKTSKSKKKSSIKPKKKR